MAQIDHRDHWIITENIVRFQSELKSEADTCQRKLLEGLLVLEREKLKATSPETRSSFGTAAEKVPQNDQAEKNELTARKNTDPVNRLLGLLPRADYVRFCRYLKPVELKYRQSLYRANKPISFVYSIETGVGSLVNTMVNGDAAEVSTIGNEGIVGLPVVLDDERAPTAVYVQVPGAGLRMKASRFKKELARSVSLRTVMHHYTHAFFNQVAQSAACNQFHSLEQRCSRWLLMTHDRMGADSFLLTQEFLAVMLGVRRAGVSAAASALQRAGVINYNRGKVVILDRCGLESRSCECYGISKLEFDRLLGVQGRRSSK